VPRQRKPFNAPGAKPEQTAGDQSPAPLVVPGAIYLVVHLVLDWLSQRYPDGTSGIIALNPAAGLGIVLVCHYGRILAGWVVATAIISSILLRNTAESLTVAGGEGFIVGSIYAGSALVLSSPILNFNSRLSTLRDLLVLMAVAVSSSALVAVSYVAGLASFGGIQNEGFATAVSRYWIGDLIGISIMAPFGLLLLQSRIQFRPSRRSLLQAAITALLLIAAIQFRENGRFPYFYFLFLPVIWVAVVSGFEGVVITLALIQAGMVCAVIVMQMSFLDITDFQARMVALAATALIAGALVTDRRRVEEETRRQHEALAQIATRGSMGELGTAIAHEVNQPLSAAGTFAGLVVESLEAETVCDPSLLENARKVVRQIDRASGVIRGLRALVRLTNDHPTPSSVDHIIADVAELASFDAARLEIELKVAIRAGLPLLSVDRLQIEQAMINLTRNAMEAIDEAQMTIRCVTLYASEAEGGAVEIGVIDTGPGFSPGFSLDLLRPFKSKKADGLGVGLSLCRSIGIANGARLWHRDLEAGAQVCLTFDLDRRVINGQDSDSCAHRR